MIRKEQISRYRELLNELEVLLERQISFSNRGNLSGVELLSSQVDSLVKKIGRLKLLELAEFQSKHKRLAELYAELQFALMTEKGVVGRELQFVRRSRKAIGAYHSNA